MSYRNGNHGVDDYETLRSMIENASDNAKLAADIGVTEDEREDALADMRYDIETAMSVALSLELEDVSDWLSAAMIDNDSQCLIEAIFAMDDALAEITDEEVEQSYADHRSDWYARQAEAYCAVM